MNTLTPSRRQLIDAINDLPSEVLPELANFLTYLQFKVGPASQTDSSESGSEFLLAIAGLGEAETDLSEQDEEILAQEIDPLRGWGFENEEAS